jgi:uncharacterized protein (DUF4415 family)
MKATNTGTVKFRLDPQNPPRLTEKQKAALREKTIDYSDLPPRRGGVWTRPGALVPAENKQQITLRLDADVVQFFRKTGKKYQSRINAALREYMDANKKAV